MKTLAMHSERTVQDVVREQAGLLQREIVNGLPPKSRESMRAGIQKEIKSYFAVDPGGDKWWPKQSKKSGQGPMLWLYASPAVLVGIQRELDLRRAPTSAVLSWLRMAQKNEQLGSSLNARITIDRRGAQSVVALMKPLISERKLISLVNGLTRRAGRLKASFALGWSQLNPQRRLAAWIARHLPNGPLGKTQINLSGKAPSVTFGSWAHGNAHPYAKRAISRAVTGRLAKLRANIAYRMRGYRNHRVIMRQHA